MDKQRERHIQIMTALGMIILMLGMIFGKLMQLG